jgi:hypothetical protein
LRLTAGAVPVTQLGMNVKQWIPDVQTDLFKKFIWQHEAFAAGSSQCDVVIFSPQSNYGGARRRR